jgi:menaquinone-specific isochorismate synthase
MATFEIDGRVYSINQLDESLPDIDLIRWLDSQPIYPKVFWRERDSSITRAAVGNLLSFGHVPRFSDSTSPDIRLYGGIRFAPKSHDDETWGGFPGSCFWLPQIEVSQGEDKTQAIHYSLNERSVVETNPLGEMRINDYSLLDRQETPCRENWDKGVAEVLEEISSGHIAKVVMARKTACRFAKLVSVWPLFTHLVQKAKSATLFAFQLSPTLCFMGATPEKLFHREGNLLSTDAVAATRARGKTPEEDLQLEQDLLSNPKELREFAIVKDFLTGALAPLSEAFAWEGPDRILKASHVQHIHNRLNATLKNGVSDADLIRALHPTPALGGFPREAALSFLQKKEPFDRGWYGAPIGTISPQRSALYVAIRSALIRERSLHLFAGTGLVAGSDASREWEELEQKIRPFTELFI